MWPARSSDGLGFAAALLTDAGGSALSRAMPRSTTQSNSRWLSQGLGAAAAFLKRTGRGPPSPADLMPGMARNTSSINFWAAKDGSRVGEDTCRISLVYIQSMCWTLRLKTMPVTLWLSILPLLNKIIRQHSMPARTQQRSRRAMSAIR